MLHFGRLWQYRGMNRKIRVIIADDHTLVRKNIKALLETQSDIEVIGTAENGEEALKLVNQLLPDVVVMDIAMPKMNGIMALEHIQALRTPAQVIILTMYAMPMLVQQALKKGAQAYILKERANDDLPQAIRSAQRGELYLSAPLQHLAPAPQSNTP